MINLPQGNRSSYGASGGDAPLASSTDRGTLEHRDALQRGWTMDDIDRAYDAGAITRLERRVLSVDLMVDALAECLDDGKPVRDRHKAQAVESTINAVSTARNKGVKKLIDFLAS
jgi:hypothetical protein